MDAVLLISMETLSPALTLSLHLLLIGMVNFSFSRMYLPLLLRGHKQSLRHHVGYYDGQAPSSRILFPAGLVGKKRGY
jgi:hypothetical protein